MSSSSTAPAGITRAAPASPSTSARYSTSRPWASPTVRSSPRASGRRTNAAPPARCFSKVRLSGTGSGHGRAAVHSPSTPRGAPTPAPRSRSCSRARAASGRRRRSAKRAAWPVRLGSEEAGDRVVVPAGGSGVGAGDEVRVAVTLNAPVDLAGLAGRGDVRKRLPQEVRAHGDDVEAVTRRELEHGIDRSGRAAVEREVERVLVRRVSPGRAGGDPQQHEQRDGRDQQYDDTSHRNTSFASARTRPILGSLQ